jgi:hypothetical protein
VCTLTCGAFTVTSDNHLEQDSPHNNSCKFHNNEPNLIYFFDDQPITDEMVEFPEGTELVRNMYIPPIYLGLEK